MKSPEDKFMDIFLWGVLVAAAACFLVGLMGCASMTPVMDTKPTVRPSTTATTGGALSPVVQSPVTQTPIAESQGFLTYLNQKTVGGIDPWGFVMLLVLQLFLSHRRERLRILQRTGSGVKRDRT